VTRRLAVTAFISLAAFATSLAAQTVHKVQLPCESRNQELSPTGTQLAAFCKDHSLHLVAISSGAERTVAGRDPRVNTAVFSLDGQWLAIGFTDGMVRVIPTMDDQTPAKEWKAGARRIDTLYFFPDGKHLFVGPVDSPGTVWDIAGEPALLATLTVEFGGILTCAVSPDGKLLVAAGDDTVLRWYDIATWNKKAENRDFLLETFALQFTPDGKFLLTGGADSRITLLDAATGKQVRQLTPDPGSYIVDIEMMGDKQRVATVYLDDAGNKPPHALVWNLTTAKSVPLKMDARPTCGGVASGKLWLCSTDGNTVTISQYD
jgi:WD40 repeat protein